MIYIMHMHFNSHSPATGRPWMVCVRVFFSGVGANSDNTSIIGVYINIIIL